MAPTMKPTAWNSVFAQMRIWKRDSYKRKEVNAKDEDDTVDANLNFDEKLRIEVAILHFENEIDHQADRHEIQRLHYPRSQVITC